jgi:hypothetical protein
MRIFITALIFGFLLLTFSAKAQVCDIDVYNLSIEANYISAYIKNTGSIKQNVNWYIWIDNNVRFSGTFAIDAGQSLFVNKEWPFTIGEHSVVFEANSACANDSEHAIHIVLPVETPTGPTFFCNVPITKFDYLSLIKFGDESYARVEIKNTAFPLTINVSFWLDGKVNQSESFYIDAGQIVTKMFYFYPSLGNHTINVTVNTPCGSTYNVNGTIFVQPIITIQPTQPPTETLVTVTPLALEMAVNSTESIAVNIRSAITQNFSINVSGVPEEWLNFESEKTVEKIGTFYIDIMPQQQGNFKLFITAKANTENKTFNFVVNVYAGIKPTIGEMWQKLQNDLQALIKFYQENPIWLIITIIIIAAIVIGIGAAKLREEGIFG